MITMNFIIKSGANLNRQYLRANHSFSQLQSILSKMKAENKNFFPNDVEKLGNSDLFNYSTNKDYEKSNLKTGRLVVWEQLLNADLESISYRAPLNGFEEMIQLTKDGKLWHYPIDNEVGLDEEKKVPFEEHIFLDKHLENFPKNESIRAYMELIIMGLSKNPYMSVDRKKHIIKFYEDYFNSKGDIYKKVGFDINSA